MSTHTHTHTHTLTLYPSQQDNAKLLQERAVAYINADSAIEGECVSGQLNILIEFKTTLRLSLFCYGSCVRV